MRYLMAVPNRPAQISAVAKFLEDPANDERTVTDVAKIIVDGMYDLWTRGESDPPIPLNLGMAFKAPLVAKVYFVGWIGEMWWGPKLGTVETAWIISSDSDYGSLMPVDRPFWRIVTPSTAKSGAPGNNKDEWKPGDVVSVFQRSASYEILAVGDKCVLMSKLGSPTMIYAESNAGLKRYYNKERT
jgi:hypothetical protein